MKTMGMMAALDATRAVMNGDNRPEDVDHDERPRREERERALSVFDQVRAAHEIYNGPQDINVFLK